MSEPKANANANANANPTTPAVEPAAASTPPAAQTVTLAAEEVQRLRDLESKWLKDVEAKEAQRLQALAEKGQVQEALNQQNQAWQRKQAEAEARFADLERRVLNDRRDAAIADALRGRTFVGDSAERKAEAATMVQQLLANDFEAARNADGTYAVREKATGRPAAEALAERLDSPRFALFQAASSKGGAGAGGDKPPAGSGEEPKPGSLEAIAAAWKERQATGIGLGPLTG